VDIVTPRWKLPGLGAAAEIPPAQLKLGARRPDSVMARQFTRTCCQGPKGTFGRSRALLFAVG
jgi:hypothetical protein